nr:unnamed protein product [Digitaria exilis]
MGSWGRRCSLPTMATRPQLPLPLLLRGRCGGNDGLLRRGTAQWPWGRARQLAKTEGGPEPKGTAGEEQRAAGGPRACVSNSDASTRVSGGPSRPRPKPIPATCPALPHRADPVAFPFPTPGFRKVDPDRWEFANEGFLRGQRHLLKNIRRRKPPAQNASNQQSHGSYLEVGHFGYDAEIDRLKRDKQLLMAEVVKLRQEQQNTKANLKAMEDRLQGTEQKQQQMMAFLARVMRNPEFLKHLVSQNEMRKELQDAISKKRRRRIDQGPEVDDLGISSSLEQGSPVLFNPQDSVEFLVDGIPTDLESPAFDDQSLVEPQEVDLGTSEQQQDMPQEDLTDNFWAQLLNEGLGEENENPVVEDDMNLLSEKMGYLNSDGPASGK